VVFVEKEKRECVESVDGPPGKGGIHMQEQEQMLREGGQQGNGALQRSGLLVILFCLLVTLVMVLAEQRQNNDQLCATAANVGYNYQQAAYTIGVTAQKYRAGYNNGRGTTANFGGAAITLCSDQGREYTKYSPMFKGYDYPESDLPENSTHSEQQAYGWVINTLTPAKLQAGDHIYVTIYSEIPVCQQCKIDMQDWNSDFQALVLGKTVQTQIWQMRRGSRAAVGKNPVDRTRGFVPAKFPAGTGIPLQYRDVEIVSINFR